MRRILILSSLLTFTMMAGAQDKLYHNEFPLGDVTLLDGPLKKARDLNIKTLLQYDCDRLLAPYRKEAGLEPRAKTYPNWDGLDGHVGGHYLTAMAINAATGNAECQRRMEYMISELQLCADANAKNHPEWGRGYVGGMPNSERIWSTFKKGDFGVYFGSWAPFYNLHKMYAGLRDAWLYCGNEQAKTLFLGFCDWAIDLTSGLSDEQMERMLGNEHGGMNEVLADAYAITQEPKYLSVAMRFSHRRLLTPMSQRVDNLDNMHANRVQYHTMKKEYGSLATHRGFLGKPPLKGAVDPFPCNPSDEAFVSLVSDFAAKNIHAFPWPSGYNWTLSYGTNEAGVVQYDWRRDFMRETASHACVTRDGKVVERTPFWLHGGAYAKMCGGDDWTRRWFSQDVAGELRLGELSAAVSNLTQAVLVFPLADRGGEAGEEGVLSFRNLGKDALMLRPRRDVELLIPADSFFWNLLRSWIEMAATLTLVVAFGLFLSAIVKIWRRRAPGVLRKRTGGSWPTAFTGKPGARASNASAMWAR